MKCFGSYQNDRICELCNLIKPDLVAKCSQKYNQEQKKYKQLMKQLREIEMNCPYREISYDEYIPFNSCNKNGNGYGRHADECKPKLECKIK